MEHLGWFLLLAFIVVISAGADAEQRKDLDYKRIYRRQRSVGIPDEEAHATAYKAIYLREVK
jgi:hypothetical protein